MVHDLLLQLENKVENTLELVAFLKLQVEELEDENMLLKADQEKWRNDLLGLVHRLDLADHSPEETYREEDALPA